MKLLQILTSLLLAAGAAGLSGCVPKVSPAEYYAAMRHSQGPVSEEKTAELRTLDYYPADGGERRRIVADRAALARYRREHPEEIRAAHDYLDGMKDGQKLGLLGLDLRAAREEMPPEEAPDRPPEEDRPAGPTPWEEGLYVGNRQGLAAHAVLVFLFEHHREVGHALEQALKGVRGRARKEANAAVERMGNWILERAFGEPDRHEHRPHPPPPRPPWIRGADFPRDIDPNDR